MPLITVRVDERTKRRMDELSLNWSEAIRKEISRVLEEETRKNRVRAAQIAVRIRMPAAKGWDSTKVIRAWRDARYGPRGRR